MDTCIYCIDGGAWDVPHAAQKSVPVPVCGTHLFIVLFGCDAIASHTCQLLREHGRIGSIANDTDNQHHHNNYNKKYNH